MPDEMRILQLLEDVLESRFTPEEACSGDPELLTELRRELDRIRRVELQLDEMFPHSGPAIKQNGISPVAEPTKPLPDGYDVEGVLGRGGMGVVYKARQRSLNRPVALKTLLAGAFAGPLEMGRFRREAEAVAGLRHPNIVQVYDAGDFEGRPFFTMELVEGGSLAAQLTGSPQPVLRAAESVAILAGAVQFAHSNGIVHRDLKPANILIAADGTLKISDFGLALLMEDGDRLTLTGARIGTPAYMAPEQAFARAGAVGPTADVYALGAILYELLTGRPPFVGESAADTERQVISDDPIPPSRLNARVPRDLETICLKCLQKNPGRRYASALDLATDLQRFLDGKPVLARPTSMLERMLKRARRRPIQAILVAGLLVTLGMALGLGIWIQRQQRWLQQQENARNIEKAGRQERTREAVESTINKAYESGRAERWDEADLILAEAANHLSAAEPDDLHSRVERAHADLQFARNLEWIRTMEQSAVTGRFIVMQPSYPAYAEKYARAFAEDGLESSGDTEAAAAQIRAKPLPEQSVAAIELWAFAEFRLNRETTQKQLLRIARSADPDPGWRDRFRDPALWHDKHALLRLANDAAKASPPPLAHQLAIIGALLRDLGEKEVQTRLLRDALAARPGDFWLNWEMAGALARNKRLAESATYLRIVNALRPLTSRVENLLGVTLCQAGEFDESVRYLRAAVGRAPENEWYRHNLVLALENAGRFSEARIECQREIEANPKDYLAYQALGGLLWERGRYEDGIRMFQKSCDVNSSDPGVRCNLGAALKLMRRFDEALTAFRKAIDIRGSSMEGHCGAGECLAKLGRHEEAIVEFSWIIRELDPAKKQTLVDPGDGPSLYYVDARLGLAESFVCLGRFGQASAATELALELVSLQEQKRQFLRHQLNICQRLVPLENQLTSILAENHLPDDVETRRALAEWCYLFGRRHAAAARLFESAFAQQPALADKLESGYRFSAACAAAVAGNGLSDDSTMLGDAERAALRKKSFDWLTADLHARAKRIKSEQGGAASTATDVVTEWLRNENLACIRDRAWLSRLSEPERKQWQGLWAEVRALTPRDNSATLRQARAFAAKAQWKLAAESYAELFDDAPYRNDGEVWFEYAATQLLSGDRQGYLRTCGLMLDGSSNARRLRSYLVARACTLSNISEENVRRSAVLCSVELNNFANSFWSLTQRGAICCRLNRAKEAKPYLDRSLNTDNRPGNAVLDWLWLALACHESGEEEPARRWLEKANSWLDAFNDDMPVNAERTMGLHLHNWLEAHLLRQEAEAQINLSSPAGAAGNSLK